MSTPRKIVQITAIPETAYSLFTVFALADDGTIWQNYSLDSKAAWNQVLIDPLPERES